MEIDQTETSRKRLREEGEEEFKELAKRAKVEIEVDYTQQQAHNDYIQENYINSLLNFNADVFGGVVAFLGIEDIVKLNTLNHNHRHNARQAASYTETVTDVAWIRDNLVTLQNPGKYRDIFMPLLQDVEFKYMSKSTISGERQRLFRNMPSVYGT
jgi:hypothetical protein